MDWQIRLVIIALGGLLVGWVVWDYQRKKKKQAEQQRLIEKLRAEAERVDASGFDATGVGSVRVRTRDEILTEPSAKTNSDSPQVRRKDNADVEMPDERAITAKGNPGDSTKEESKQSDEKNASTKVAPPGISVNPEMVFSLILQAKGDAGFQGKDFMPLLLSQGLRHGEMGIFHRHQGSGGKPGPVIYSVANAVEPGYFDIKNIQQLQTPAFALFMTLPGPEDPLQAYESMVRTGRLLEKELGGLLLDGQKSRYCEQTHQHQLEQIQAWIHQHQIR